MIGAQKCGTTALQAMLSQHPSIIVPADELHVFDARRRPDQSYREHFPRWTLKKLGDVTPIYIYWQDCPERIAAWSPSVKVIAILRCPVERAWSHWRMEFQRGFETLSFQAALLAEDARLSGGQHKVFSYRDRGRYGWQIKRIQRLFGNRALFLKYEDYQKDNQSALSACFRHVGVRDYTVVPEKARVGTQKTMSADSRHWLAERLEPEARAAERLLGWDCSDWCVR